MLALVKSLPAVATLASWQGAQSTATVTLIQSSDLTGDMLVNKGRLDTVPDFPFEGPIVNILDDLDQEIIGFGGAFTEASAMVFQELPKDEQERFLQLYFGKDGIGYTAGRTHINSCDFSPTYYTFDDVDGDFDLQHFDMNVTHDTAALIPLIQGAQRVLQESGKELKIMATAWSPPGWMKTNEQMLGSLTPGLKDSCKASWAKYFSKWISAYKAKGIPIWAVTPQNEAENDGIWESCVYTPQREMDFIATGLGPILKEDHPEVQIYIFDHNKDHVYAWTKALYENKEALKYTTGVAFHWYTGDEFQNVIDVHKDFPEMTLLSTEVTYDQSRLHGASVADGNWDFALGYGHEIIGDLNAGAAMFLDWNLLLSDKGGPNKVGNNCDAPMVSNGEKFFIHPQYYAMGHFSKFILPGSKRIDTKVSNSHTYTGEARPYGSCDAGDGLQATSFLQPQGSDYVVAVVVLNCGKEEIVFKLTHRTSAIKVTIPGRAIQTFLINPEGSSEIVV